MSEREFNRQVKRVNEIERIFRPNAAELMVPDVVGLKENNAQTILQEHGFKPGEITGVVTGRRNVGEVAAQSPVAGERIRPGAAVRLEVEVQPTLVPNVVGSTLQDAQRIIAGAQLKVGNVREQLEVGADSGIVRTQSVAARGEVEPGTAIDLVVSEKGSQVPRLSGRNREEATSDLRSADLKLGRVTTRASRERVNTIIDQDPDSGAIVKAGSEVNIVLAEQCTVPNLQRMSRNDAIARVQDAELVARVYTTSGANTDLETVHQQKPQAGSKLNCGSVVEVGLGYWTVQ
jgi:serine/threonine-protein kinase